MPLLEVFPFSLLSFIGPSLWMSEYRFTIRTSSVPSTRLRNPGATLNLGCLCCTQPVTMHSTPDSRGLRNQRGGCGVMLYALWISFVKAVYNLIFGVWLSLPEDPDVLDPLRAASFIYLRFIRISRMYGPDIHSHDENSDCRCRRVCLPSRRADHLNC